MMANIFQIFQPYFSIIYKDWIFCLIGFINFWAYTLHFLAIFAKKIYRLVVLTILNMNSINGTKNPCYMEDFYFQNEI